MMLTISIIVVVCLAAFALMPAAKKPGESTALQSSGPQVVYRDAPAPVYQQVSQRQLRIDDDAAAIAGLYRQRAHDAYMEELAATGSRLIAGTKAEADA